MRTAWLAVCMFGLAAASPARGQTAPAVERFGDWEFLCPATSDAAAAGKKSCRLIQNHAADGGKTVLLVTVLQPSGQPVPVAVVSVPKDVYLAPGIEMKVDGGQTFKLLYETCNDSGCHAGYRLTGDIAAALKKGQIATHKVHDAKQTAVTVPVSLKGLSKGLERLAGADK